MRRSLLLAAALAATLAALPASAQPRLSGSFTANQSCPALQSIRQQSNPGRVTVEPGHAYPVLAKNRPDATYYQIVIDGAQPPQRWVPTTCGQLSSASADATASPGGPATDVLALGWEPAFCREHGQTAECASMTSDSDDARSLSLHGLWPQPRGKAYCNVDPRLVQADKAHRWDQLPEPDISPATRQHLAAVMPGLQSGLERHEWIVHGTCFGATADAYFARAAGLVEQVDESPVRDLFAANVGGTVTNEAIRAAFDQAFGSGAGARVAVSCSGRGQDRQISELVVSLAGDVAGAATLGDLILAAAPVPPGCPSGVVDRPAR